ncbi:hypothetical protein ACH3VR_22105 [Microbacterium sp. B2969]|uniref:Uncharacterized protein n=1 Tax=Microbacterium alkaliflavum TaxID=3248839 RepID=A0ABW7QDV1_9MICO
MFTQATDELDLFGNAFAGYEYFPYLLLAGLPLCLLYLGLRRRPTPHPAPRNQSPSPVQRAATPATKTRYVDVDARSVHTPRAAESRADIFDYFQPAATATIDTAPATETPASGSDDPASSRSATEQTTRSLDELEDLDERKAIGWGVVIVGAAIIALLLLTGWRFPGTDNLQGLTTAGWWAIGVLVTLSIPAILRKALREKSLGQRLDVGGFWLLLSTATMALVVVAVGLGLSTPMFRIWLETPGEPQQTAITTETIVPSSVTFKSGSYFGIILGGTSAEVSGLVKTDDGVRTFSTSRYRYGDDWQLTTEKTCTTTTYNSPLVIQKPIRQEQCSTSTIAVLGKEITEH